MAKQYLQPRIMIITNNLNVVICVGSNNPAKTNGSIIDDNTDYDNIIDDDSSINSTTYDKGGSQNGWNF